MSQEIARKSIDWLFAASRDAHELGLTLFGGEPLLNKPVFQFVMEYSDTLAKERGKTIRYTMTTNGTLLDDVVIGYIKKHNFGLMVSLDGPRDFNDRQGRFPDGSGSSEAAAKGIKALMQRRRRVTVRCTWTKARPRIVDLVEFFEDFGFSRVVMGIARNPFGETDVSCNADDIAEFDRQQEEEVLPWILDELDRGEVPIYFPYEDFASTQGVRKKSSVIKCGACHGTTTVGADGCLYPCHRFVGMSAFKIGCLDSGALKERAECFWRNYDRAVRDTCSKCWARNTCGRPCPWSIARPDGSSGVPNGSMCRLARHSLERGAWFLWHLQTKHPELCARLTGSTQD